VKKRGHFKQFAEAARQNTPHVHVCARPEAPNFNQIKRKSGRFRATMLATNVGKASSRFWDLKFGASLEFGGWCLGFFTHPKMHRRRMRFRKKETPPGLHREGRGLVSVLPCRLLCCAFVP
jgi:hypothetical protein